MKTLLAVVTVFLGIQVAGAEEIRLRYLEWSPIPENQGIEAFLGTWVPGSQQSRDACGLVMIEEGVIRHAKTGPYCQDIRYRIVETTPTYVILATKTKSGERLWYDFEYLRINDRLPSTIRLGYCASHLGNDPESPFYLGERIFTMSDAELKALWDKDVPCNPRHLPPDRQPFYDNWSSSVLFFDSNGSYDNPKDLKRQADGTPPLIPAVRP